ncbi:hypothetical protein [Aquabacterium sp.]|uniref:hypothetical protein n=1 Tax=Aquabacterium TaxID=92793 RepID=UPI001D62D92E|nr:hypothetical protein [Aquabacterium sp.]MBT9608755.1 hypothetical protein [Aquabacterium sp.]|tara:strand:+ start:815 stop:2269 length:1455 start_codon:yes stop_codon:yes gene_type:complete
MSTQDHKALPSVVVPPEGWTLHHDKWGFMGRDSSPGGRLVRLADVLQHIERNRALSRADALSVLADGLREDDGRSVFILRPGDSPRQLTKADYFGFPAPAVAPAPASATGWARDEPRHKGPFAGFGSDEWRSEAFRVVPDGMTTYQPHAPGPKPRKASTVQPGVQALIERMKLDWLKAGKGRVLPSIDDEAKRAARFAVLMNRAHEFWGYGRLQPLQPPASWCLKSTFGYMACNREPGGLLVRLYDVMTWIEEAENVSPKEAHDMVEKVIGTLSNADLFNLRSDDYASPLNGSEQFGPIRSFWDAQTPPDELGIASLKVWLSGGFCPYVAVRMVRAYDLWGYGAPSDQPATIPATADGPQPVQAQALPLAPALAPDPFEGLNEDQRRRMKGLTGTDQADLVKLREELKRPPGKTGRAKSWTPWQRVTANYLQEKIGMDALAVILGRDVNTLTDTLDDAKVRKATATLNRLSGGPSLAANPTKRS